MDLEEEVSPMRNPDTWQDFVERDEQIDRGRRRREYSRMVNDIETDTEQETVAHAEAD